MQSDLKEIIEPALSPLFESLRADGAELIWTSDDQHRIEFQLDLRDASCADCVLPKASLEQMLLFAARKASPDLREVVVHDPRDTSS